MESRPRLYAPAPRFWTRHAALPGLLLGAVFLSLELFDLDRAIARAWFFAPSTGWLGAGAGDWWAHELLHDGGRWLVRGVAAGALVTWLVSFAAPPLRPWRRSAGFIALTMLASVSLVGALKAVTNVDCPWDLSGFGGSNPWVPLFSDRPGYLPRAQCFPGAHSSSGFALVCFYFLWRDRAPRLALAGLLAGILVGVAFAIGQEARGAHFLSHDLASAAIVWFMQLALYAWLRRPRNAAGGVPDTPPAQIDLSAQVTESCLAVD